MMRKAYESPEMEYFKLSFEATLNGIEYSKNEDFQQSGDEGDDRVPGGN